MRVTGIVPAAGWATRLNHTEGSKEMLQVMGRPVMDHIVARMRFVSPASIRVVTRPTKVDLVAHARQLKLEVLTAETRSVGHSIEIGVKDLSDDDVALVGFPDTVWQPEDGFQRLIARMGTATSMVLGLFTSDEPDRGDVVQLDDSGRVTRVDIKPRNPKSRIIWACAVARVSALRGVGDYEYPGELIGRLAHQGQVDGVWLSDNYLDIGTPEALKRAAAL